MLPANLGQAFPIDDDEEVIGSAQALNGVVAFILTPRHAPLAEQGQGERTPDGEAAITREEPSS